MKKQLKHLTSHTQLTQDHVSQSEMIRSLQARKRPGVSELTQLFSANLRDRDARLTPFQQENLLFYWHLKSLVVKLWNSSVDVKLKSVQTLHVEALLLTLQAITLYCVMLVLEHAKLHYSSVGLSVCFAKLVVERVDNPQHSVYSENSCPKTT